MGRQGPKLVPFLHNGVINRKYRNLIPEDALGLKFSIVLPHKTKKLEVEDELIFKDWYALNGKKYIFASKHYTDAKQAMTASLRKSDYVEKVHCTDDKLTYRILNKAEVKEKKRQKKELKKNETKKETPDSDAAALSSEESGYGSGADSPLSDFPLVSTNDNLTASSGEELLQASYTMDADSFFGINSLESTYSDNLNRFIKSEPMDVNISVADSHAVPDYLANIQPFANDLHSTDYFPKNTPGLNLMEYFPDASELNNSGFTEELPIENGYDFLQFDNMSVEDLNNVLLKDFPTYNFNSSLVCEDYINEQATEMQNVEKLPAESEDLLTEDLFKKLMEDISTTNFHPSVANEDNKQENIMPSPDAGSNDQKSEANENVYFCKKCIHLGKIPILFCEPQFENGPSETGEIKIAFEERILKEINGFKCVKEYKFINDHLMVILEPNDD